MKVSKNKIIIGAFAAAIGIGTLGFIIKNKYMPKVPLKEYKELCLELAVIDDEICRNELEGNTVHGEEITFGSKGETVQYRYELFLEMYKDYTKEMLDEEREALYIRLAESKQYVGMEKQELELDFED